MFFKLSKIHQKILRWCCRKIKPGENLFLSETYSRKSQKTSWSNVKICAQSQPTESFSRCKHSKYIEKKLTVVKRNILHHTTHESPRKKYQKHTDATASLKGKIHFWTSRLKGWWWWRHVVILYFRANRILYVNSSINWRSFMHYSYSDWQFRKWQPLVSSFSVSSPSLHVQQKKSSTDWIHQGPFTNNNRVEKLAPGRLQCNQNPVYPITS